MKVVACNEKSVNCWKLNTSLLCIYSFYNKANQFINNTSPSSRPGPDLINSPTVASVNRLTNLKSLCYYSEIVTVSNGIRENEKKKLINKRKRRGTKINGSIGAFEKGTKASGTHSSSTSGLQRSLHVKAAIVKNKQEALRVPKISADFGFCDSGTSGLQTPGV